MSRMSVYFGVSHFVADTESRTGRVDAPIHEVLTASDFVNPKSFVLTAGETRSINVLVSNPRFDAFACLMPKDQGVLDLWFMKDTPTSTTNLSPTNSNRRWFQARLRYPFPVCLSQSAVRVDPDIAVDRGRDGATGFPALWASEDAVTGFVYRLLVHRPAMVFDYRARAYVNQTGSARFSMMLVQGGAT